MWLLLSEMKNVWPSQSGVAVYFFFSILGHTQLRSDPQWCSGAICGSGDSKEGCANKVACKGKYFTSYTVSPSPACHNLFDVFRGKKVRQAIWEKEQDPSFRWESWGILHAHFIVISLGRLWERMDTPQLFSYIKLGSINKERLFGQSKHTEPSFSVNI